MSIQEMAESEQLWKLVEEEPLEFELLKEGPLQVVGYEEPNTNCRAYAFGEADLQSQGALVSKAKEVYAVMCALQDPYDEYRSDKIDLFRELEDAEGLRKFEKKWPEHADEQLVCKWVLQLPEEGFKELCSQMREWAQSEPDWIMDWEGFQVPSDGIECAFEFFKRGPRLEKGDDPSVILIWGEDQPFSTYYAAELSVSVEEANARAKEAGIPMKFREAE